jgi:CheY-like chemotaxis protein/predicted regulator of Ras-like GTPase activity (Roadblock/LC7/MglB family)
MVNEHRTVLVVDDEALFLKTVADGFRAMGSRIELVTAANGSEALAVLASRRVDLVVTDLKMPECDGFELLAAMSRQHAGLPVLVMTAFGTPEIERRLRGVGVDQYLDKPLDFRVLAERVQQALAASMSGRVTGITLPSFLQLLQMERKSCSLRVACGPASGLLHLDRGELVDASAGELSADEAALEIVCWEDGQIEIEPLRKPVTRTIRLRLQAILMEAFRQKDEHARGASASATPAAPPPPTSAPPEPTRTNRTSTTPPEKGTKETTIMATTKDKLQELAALDGFAGAGVFNPTGEELALLPGSVTNIRDVGVVANAVLLNAQKASLEMGAGRGQVVHIEGEKSHILVRCMNEGTDPLKSQPGRAHIHAVLVLKPEASLGMAKMRLAQAVEKLAEDFR